MQVFLLIKKCYNYTLFYFRIIFTLRLFLFVYMWAAGLVLHTWTQTWNLSKYKKYTCEILYLSIFISCYSITSHRQISDGFSYFPNVFPPLDVQWKPRISRCLGRTGRRSVSVFVLRQTLLLKLKKLLGQLVNMSSQSWGTRFSQDGATTNVKKWCVAANKRAETSGTERRKQLCATLATLARCDSQTTSGRH